MTDEKLTQEQADEKLINDEADKRRFSRIVGPILRE